MNFNRHLKAKDNPLNLSTDNFFSEAEKKKNLLVYIPSYNCRERLLGVLDEVPKELWGRANFLVIDNQSTDGTIDALVAGNESGRWSQRVHIIQPKQNRGYSGSQKLAYNFAIKFDHIKSVVMLHGDGQYDPNMILQMFPEVGGENGIVYGYRSKRVFWSKDETPLHTYLIIKILSIMESLLTGVFRKEWHSGFVMYQAWFLKKINFENITPTMHIDGHMLFAAGSLKVKTKGLPIYKRYKNYPALGGTARLKYVMNVFQIIPRLHFIDIKKQSLESETSGELQSLDFSCFSLPKTERL